MTEAKALVLIISGSALLTTVAVLSMAALGVTGVALSLGAIVPLALAADGIGRVVMHYGRSDRGESGQARH
ncbi:MAG TPA: hypothetical protein VHU86_03710 [Solirubrobacterales bacterium]|jgi:hypothetical protein|nr:hypothetical protein [Solirubrobacterales bacterium]